ncbi:MAG: PEP-CTERM sorting domain-containing protein, partial [Gammaproteobacteria bacterium]|nr:PEP-CTERM sorting domain-containing protein [Gammaproteobacteria bacterium]
GGYDLFMDAVDADLWTSTYNATFAASGDVLAAEDAAELAATLDTFSLGNWPLLECQWGLGPCTLLVDQTGTLTVAFDVEIGKDYFFGASANVNGYTDVSAVPVPAAVWLFGSGLIGLIGFSKRKKA